VYHYNSDIHESIFIFFGKNVTEKVGNQKVLYFPTSPSVLPGEIQKHKSSILSLKCCAISLPDFNHAVAILIYSVLLFANHARAAVSIYILKSEASACATVSTKSAIAATF